MNPVKAKGFGHNGRPGDGGGPEKYLSDQLDLNIVYSCYYEPRTADEIADELGVTPVFLSDRIAKLEGSGFLVREKGGRFTTYVEFSPLTYSLAEEEELNRKQLEAAKILADEYYPVVSDAVDRLGEIYLPTGNRQLAEMSIFLHKVCTTPVSSAGRDISRYYIKTPDGGEFIAYAVLEQTCSDPDYQPSIPMENWLCCGAMNRWSDKYPVGSWSYDTKWTSRQGAWENNLGEDYEKLYEYMTHQLPDIPANAEKLARLRERGMIDESGRVTVMVARTGVRDEIESIPSIGESVTRRFADAAHWEALGEEDLRALAEEVAPLWTEEEAPPAFDLFMTEAALDAQRGGDQSGRLRILREALMRRVGAPSAGPYAAWSRRILYTDELLTAGPEAWEEARRALGALWRGGRETWPSAVE